MDVMSRLARAACLVLNQQNWVETHEKQWKIGKNGKKGEKKKQIV